MKSYEPNDRDRHVVLVMAAIPGITHETIAKAILSERTGKPINPRTLRKHYKAELADGMVHMQKRTMTKFVQLIDDGDWRAIQMALSNYCRIKDDGGAAITIAQGAAVGGLKLEFIASKHKDEPLDGRIIEPDKQPLPHPRDYQEAEVITEPKPAEPVPAAPFDGRPGAVTPPLVRKDAFGHWIKFNYETYSWEPSDGPEG